MHVTYTLAEVPGKGHFEVRSSAMDRTFRSQSLLEGVRIVATLMEMDMKSQLPVMGNVEVKLTVNNAQQCH